MNTRQRLLFTPLVSLVALAGALALLAAWGSAPQAARALGTLRYVATGGSDVGECTDPGSPCRTVQYAVDRAGSGDEIRVATGVYTGVQARAGITQVVYISRTVTVRGGYNADFTARDPDVYTTTLDAQSLGRVLVITGTITPTVEGLRITGGDATGLGGDPGGYDAGGGVYVYTATATISDCHVYSSTAEDGGGLYLYHSPATLSGNTVTANTATATYGDGGGLYLYHSPAILDGNTVTANNASWAGGGLLLYRSDATLSDNTTISNTAEIGGGLYLYQSAATLSSNTVTANTANQNGGGLLLWESAATLSYNTVLSNTAGVDGGGVFLRLSEAQLISNTVTSNEAGDDAGGLAVYSSNATLISNTVTRNTAGDDGGGLAVQEGDVALTGNTVSNNSAGDKGGGLHLGLSPATLVNNVVADNLANNRGSGMYIASSAPQLIHSTIAHNGSTGSVTSGLLSAGPSKAEGLTAGTGGDGSGVYVTKFTGDYPYSTVGLTNTILVSHTVGIAVTAGNTATLQATLWGKGAWANGTDWDGDGAILTDTLDINLWDDPDFVDPDGGDYHIGPGSAAVDAGVDAGVTTDIDGDVRFQGWGFDLGADERLSARLIPVKQASAQILNPDQTVTYTLVITSSGGLTATAVVLTDTLPLQQQALSVGTDRGSCDRVAGWGGGATCQLADMPVGTTAHLTLTAQVTTTVPPTLPLTMRNRVDVASDETANWTDADTLLQDCYARVNRAWPEYDTVQAAVDAASEGDTVTVAGVCAGVNQRGGLTQQVYLDRSLTLQGGWKTDFTVRDPNLYPTTLNTLLQGRGIYITGEISPTIESLRITGGNATGQGSVPEGQKAGGGIYVISATATISGSHIYSNAAEMGGGIYLTFSRATLSGNTLDGNFAAVGGGLYLHASPATLTGNTVQLNLVFGRGGGVALAASQATLTENTVQNNGTLLGSGGGLDLDASPAILSANTIKDNWGVVGGGLALSDSSASLTRNIVQSNWALWWGGGISVQSSNNATLANNVIADNEASVSGGGLYVEDSDIHLLHNTLANNVAAGPVTSAMLSAGPSGACPFGELRASSEPCRRVAGLTTGSGGDGSGIYVAKLGTIYSTIGLTDTILGSQAAGIASPVDSIARLVSEIVADSEAWAGSEAPGVSSGLRWLRSTRAGTGSTGSTVAMTNTVLVSQTVGITVTAGNTVTVNGVLWLGNGANTGGAGTISVTNAYTGQPAFVDPEAGDYHIRPPSAAINRGVPAGVSTDVDGDPRPWGAAPDLGADEFACYDVTGDDQLNVYDIQAIAGHWRNPARYDPLYDLALPQGAIDIVDVMTAVAHWGEACP